MSLYRSLFRRSTTRSGDEYRFELPRRVNHRQLRNELAELFGIERGEVRRLYRDYRDLHKNRQYAAKYGERKTFNFEEAFVCFAALAHARPSGPIVEVGTQHGKSTRRILDMLDFLSLENEVFCFDVEDQVEAFSKDEATLFLEDLTGCFKERVIDRLRPSVVYLDAHPYYLTKEVITDILASSSDCLLLMHDSGKALCNPNMKLSRDDLNITSATGHWERHILCEVFGIDDPLSDEIDYQETSTHVLRVFKTIHGLAAIVPRGNRQLQRA